MSPKSDLKAFSRHCDTYLRRFGVGHYGVRYELAVADATVRAMSEVDSVSGSARVSLNPNRNDKGIDPSLRRLAKHEALHVMLGEFSELAWGRCVSKEALRMAEEELVRKLLRLIPD